MNKKVALLLSTLFHPVFVNVLSLFIVLSYSPYLQLLPAKAFSFYVVFILVFTSIIPLLAVLLLRLSGAISDITLNNQHERNLPYLLTACAYLTLYYVLGKLPASMVIQSFVLANSSVVVLVAVINHFYKISAHGVSLGACIAVFVRLSQQSVIDFRWMIVGMVLISGLVLSARLFLQAHQLSQVVSGWLLGFAVLFLLY